MPTQPIQQQAGLRGAKDLPECHAEGDYDPHNVPLCVCPLAFWF